MTEIKGFAFVVSFLLLYSAILGTIPPALLGQTYANPAMISLEPQLISGFTDSKNMAPNNFTDNDPVWYLDYDLSGVSWRMYYVTGLGFSCGAKVLIFGIWLGGIEYYDFVAPSGESRGNILSFTEIELDATDGTIRYNLVGRASGAGVVFYWDDVANPLPADAWAADVLYMIHGVGASTQAPVNILSLMLGLLTLSIPDIPFLIQVFIVSPIYACVIYLIWFLIKEVIPFV